MRWPLSIERATCFQILKQTNRLQPKQVLVLISESFFQADSTAGGEVVPVRHAGLAIGKAVDWQVILQIFISSPPQQHTM